MNDELKHYGILGMKWGIRRFQPYPKGDGPKGRYVGKTVSQRQQKKTAALEKRVQSRISKYDQIPDKTKKQKKLEQRISKQQDQQKKDQLERKLQKSMYDSRSKHVTKVFKDHVKEGVKYDNQRKIQKALKNMDNPKNQERVKRYALLLKESEKIRSIVGDKNYSETYEAMSKDITHAKVGLAFATAYFAESLKNKYLLDKYL